MHARAPSKQLTLCFAPKFYGDPKWGREGDYIPSKFLKGLDPLAGLGLRANAIYTDRIQLRAKCSSHKQFHSNTWVIEVVVLVPTFYVATYWLEQHSPK